jgi:hypothetical protein
LSRIQVALSSVSLALCNRIEIAVLVNTADLSRECHNQGFIVRREGSSLITDETNPTVNMGWRSDGCGQKREHVRMLRRQLQVRRVAADVVTAQRASLGDNRPKDPGDGVTNFDPRCRVRSIGDEALQRPVLPIEDAKRDVCRAKQIARGHAYVLQEAFGVPL